MNTRTVRDPFLNKDVQVSNRLTDRLRGRYAVGPVMPNGEPEFGWRQHDVPPIQIEAADYIEALEAVLREYESDYCEGWCRDAPPQAMFDCGGCRARAALAPEQDR